MRALTKTTPAWALLLLSASVLAEGGTVKRFISCPVYRDTVQARKSGCWLVTELESGLRFDLQQAHTKPQLGHEILVEGEMPAADKREADLCGGIVLKPVRVSVLPTSCPSPVLPAEGYPGKLFVLPGSVMTPNFLPQPMPAPPYVSRRFTIQFDLNDDYLLYQHAEVPLQTAARLARLGQARRILITGYAATAATEVSGRTVQESMAVAEARARMVGEALFRLGVERSMLELQWKGDSDVDPATPVSLREAAKRRVTIDVEIP